MIQVWKWFGNTARKLRNMKWSPENAVKVQALNDALPPILRKAMFAYIKLQYGKSEQIAMASLEALKVKLNEIL